MHRRVVHVRGGDRYDVYCGRGRCPNTGAEPHLGNPYPVEHHGVFALVHFLDHVERLLETAPRFRHVVRQELRGKTLACWCAGRYPACHAEVYARLADGDELDAIRADLLERLGLAQAGLFSGVAS